MNTRNILIAGSLVAGALVLSPGTATAAACAFDPNRVEYSDDAKIAKRQHRTYCIYRLIGRDGAFTAKGRAWIDLRNGAVRPAGTAGKAAAQLSRYRKLGLWNPNRIEYSDSPVRAVKQFTTWYAKGYIALSGGWTKRGQARFR
ncbi:hypothetical protein [Nonomuraea typhae]|uniref:hypothetical protein n=1 Tax=Nonomuraea typhae TaxID=2603600 RepID=UPI0012F843EB|nr:hypothetical protein [Nonomuraea typhae]